MVKKVKDLHSFPNGIPGVNMSYPLWDGVDTIDADDLKGVYRGDILFFDYTSRAAPEKKINSNPMIIFEGIDQNGNIVGTNLMFFNTFYDPDTSRRIIYRNGVLPVFQNLKKWHFDEVYRSGQRFSFIKCVPRNYVTIFGAKSARFLHQYIRVYNRKKMRNVMNLNPDAALSIISKTPAKYVKSKDYLK